MANVEVKIETKIVLPSQYTKVEYITIDERSPRIVLPSTTDYNTTYLYLEYMMDKPATSEYIYSIRMTSDFIGYQDNLRGNGSVYAYNYGMYDDRSVMTDGSTISYDYTPANQKNIFERKGNSIYFNNSQPQIIGDALQNYVPTGVATDDIILLGIKIDDSIRVYNNIKLYRFKLGNSERWLYDLVPCIRNSDNVAGVYDISNGVFYTDTEHGTFKAGSAIDPNNDGYPLYINKYNGLKSVESLSQSTSQPKEIFYGVVPSSGSVEAIDVKGEIAEMIQNGELDNSNLPISVYANGKQVQGNVAEDNSYNLNAKTFSVNLKSTLSDWNTINLPDIKLEPPAYVTLENMLRRILFYADYTYDEVTEMLSSTIVYGTKNRTTTIQRYLSRIDLGPLAYVPHTNVRNAVDWVCQVAQLNCIEHEGKIKFISARPTIKRSDQIIVVSPRQQANIPNVDMIVNNKYNNVKFVAREVIGGNITEIVNEDNKITFNSTTGEYDFSKFSGDNVRIETIGSTKYLRFFKTIETNGEFATYRSGNMDYTITAGETTIVSGITAFSYQKSTKETFNPSSLVEYGYVLTPYSTLTSETFAFSFSIPDRNDITNIQIVIRGQVYNIATNESLYSSGDNIYELPTDNPLLTQNVELSDINNRSKMYDIICNNIVKDYSNGLHTCTLGVVCVDYYDINGNLVKDWSKGEMLQIGDFVRIDKDNNGNSALFTSSGNIMYFKVTGRKFRYSGVPMLDLELQEVK